MRSILVRGVVDVSVVMKFRNFQVSDPQIAILFSRLLSQTGTYQCMRWGISEASEHSVPVGPLYSKAEVPRIFKLKIKLEQLSQFQFTARFIRRTEKKFVGARCCYFVTRVPHITKKEPFFL